MPHQLALTIYAPIQDGQRDEVAAVLDSMGQRGAADNERLPFAQLGGVHFARLFVVEEATDLDGDVIPPALCYMADIDAPLGRHLRELAERTGADAVFGRCAGYPAGAGATEKVRWFRRHVQQAAAIYVHTVGRSLVQVRDEARLRAALEDFADEAGAMAPGADPQAAYAAMRDFVLQNPEVRFAATPAGRPGFWFRVRDKVDLLAVPAAAVLLAPVLLPGAVIAVLLIRRLERRDVAETGIPDRRHVDQLERYEDHVAQNPFTAAGFVKPGRLRQLTMRTVLFGLNWTNRHFFHRDTLAGVRTIHFARWVPIDDGRRLIFASSYDGSLESYMDDFINRLASGLNAVFSNGVGYPSTRWLVLGGARDETAFKQYLRRHQIVTPVWYSAYDTLPAVNVDANQRLREGIASVLSSDAGAAQEWLARL